MVEDAFGVLFLLLQIVIVIALITHMWRYGRPREAYGITLVTCAAASGLCQSYVDASGEPARACAVGLMLALTVFVTLRDMRRERILASS